MKLEADRVVNALLVLGVEGPAVALDTLRAAGAYQRLYPDQINEVLTAMTRIMAKIQREGTATDA